MRLTREQRFDMLHALGDPVKDKRIKNPETILKRAYRNKFVEYHHDESWDMLIMDRFADLRISKNFDGSTIYFYFVTLKGVGQLMKEGWL